MTINIYLQIQKNSNIVLMTCKQKSTSFGNILTWTFKILRNPPIEGI